MPDILSQAATLFGLRTATSEWLGITSFFVSSYAAITIGRLRRQIVGRAKLPSMATKLRKIAKALSELMGRYDQNSEEIGLQLAMCESTVKILLRTLKGQPKTTAQSLLKQVQSYRGSTKLAWLFPKTEKTRARIWNIYETLNVLVEEIKDTAEDQRIGGQP